MARADGPRVRRDRRGGRRRGATIEPGQFVVGSFWASDNTCEICRAGYQSACVNRVPWAPGRAGGAAARPAGRRHLVATPDIPADDLIPSLLSASDVLGTGWFGAVAAEAGPGKTVAVVGDGAVGLLGVLAAKQLGAERIIAMSRHEPRQSSPASSARPTSSRARRRRRGRIKELTDGLGAHSVVEAVGTQESMMQAIRSTRPGGHVGFVGVAHDVALPGMDLFWSHVHLHGGPAPVRRFLPELIDLIWKHEIDPGKVFDSPKRPIGMWTSRLPAFSGSLANSSLRSGVLTGQGRARSRGRRERRTRPRARATSRAPRPSRPCRRSARPRRPSRRRTRPC